MPKSYAVVSIFSLCIGVTIASAGIVDRIQHIPNPIKSYFQGIKATDAFDSQYSIPYEITTFDDDLLVDDIQTTAIGYERPVTNSPIKPSYGNQIKTRPSISRPQPQSSTRRKISPPRRSNTKKVQSSPLPVTGAQAVISTHNGEVAIFTSKGRLWLNATSLERPVPLGFAKDTDSISVGNKNADHIWVNTTSWNKLVSLDGVAAGRRPFILNPDERRKPVQLDNTIIERTSLTTDIISSYHVRRTPIVQPERGAYQYDICGLNVVIPLTTDRIVLREQGLRPNYKSTGFPGVRDYPLVCNWNVKVNKVCRRARITMRVDARSRLPDVEGCTKGYLHVAPFMNQTKICGRIDSIQPYHWYVEDQQPNNVTITMKNIGINDGYSEGVSFTLQGECLPIERGTFDVDKENFEYNANWMDRLAKESATTGYGATLAVHSLNSTIKKQSFSEIHLDDGNRHVNLTYTPAIPIDQNFDDTITYIIALLE